MDVNTSNLSQIDLHKLPIIYAGRDAVILDGGNFAYRLIPIKQDAHQFQTLFRTEVNIPNDVEHTIVDGFTHIYLNNKEQADIETEALRAANFDTPYFLTPIKEYIHRGITINSLYYIQVYEKAIIDLFDLTFTNKGKALKSNLNITSLDLLSFSLNVLEAIDAMHQKGYVHLDVNLENVLIFKDKSLFKAMLSDLGASQKIGEKIERFNGKCGFASLKQMVVIDQSVKPMAKPFMDVYSWGCIVLAMFNEKEFVEYVSDIQNKENKLEFAKKYQKEMIKNILNFNKSNFYKDLNSITGDNKKIMNFCYLFKACFEENTCPDLADLKRSLENLLNN